MPMTQRCGKAVGDHLLGWTLMGSLPAALYLSIHTQGPGFPGSIANEVSLVNTNYSRINLTGLMSTVDLSTQLSTLNSTVSKGPATPNEWGPCTHVGFHYTPTGDDMQLFAVMSSTQLIYVGKEFRLIAGQMNMRFI